MKKYSVNPKENWLNSENIGSFRRILTLLLENVHLHWSWRCNWDWCYWWWITANNCNDLITVHFETGMKSNNNIIREDSLRFLWVNPRYRINKRKFILLRVEFKNSLEIWRFDGIPVWFHILWAVIQGERYFPLFQVLDKRCFDQSQHKPIQKMVHWISFQSRQSRRKS